MNSDTVSETNIDMQLMYDLGTAMGVEKMPFV